MKTKQGTKAVAVVLSSGIFLMSLVLLGAGPSVSGTMPGQLPSRQKAVRAEILSVAPQKVMLKPGGPIVSVEINGKNLNDAKSVQVTQDGAPEAEITLTAGRLQTDTVRQFSIKASARAKPGVYQLSVTASGGFRILVPKSVFDIEVEAPCPSGLPYISDWTRSPGHTGLEIKFLGQDLAADCFTARIGSTHLKITSRATNEIRAKLPAQRTKGDLVVGYGTAATEFVLQAGYVVAGDPVINSVSPQSILFGDQVTLTGTDLNMAYPLNRNQHNFIKISDSSSATLGQDFVRIDSFSTSADGSSATFRMFEAYSLQGSSVQPLSPQPSLLSGKLRLGKGGSAEMVVASPASVSYKAADTAVVITKIWPLRWGENADFIILEGDTTKNTVNVTGQGLIQGKTTAKMGAVGLTTSFSVNSQSGFLLLPTNVVTGPIVFTRDKSNVTSSVLKVIPEPKFVPATMGMLGNSTTSVFKVNLNTTYTLEGWYLQPSGVTGLTYEFLMSGLSDRAPSFLKYSLIAHTESLIRFRVDLVGPLPANYASLTLFGGTPGSYNALLLRADYAGMLKELFKRAFILVNQ